MKQFKSIFKTSEFPFELAPEIKHWFEGELGGIHM